MNEIKAIFIFLILNILLMNGVFYLALYSDIEIISRWSPVIALSILIIPNLILYLHYNKVDNIEGGLYENDKILFGNYNRYDVFNDTCVINSG